MFNIRDTVKVQTKDEYKQLYNGKTGVIVDVGAWNRIWYYLVKFSDINLPVYFNEEDVYRI